MPASWIERLGGCMYCCLESDLNIIRSACAVYLPVDHSYGVMKVEKRDIQSGKTLSYVAIVA